MIRNGTFATAIQCINCKNGGPDYASGLTFAVTGADVDGNPITVSNFLTSTLGGVPTNYFFAADVNQSGTTGLIYAQGPGVRFPVGPPPDPTPAPTSVPEPSTLLFLGTDLTALGGILRRRMSR
ncbi:MAG: PEP-CTERM sorting domain-containing protein [Acidobacteriaceae bacterium]|nr:PEP-CTERM sorting domain-containing protein [Acidobacteriaceae bacterium]